MKKELILVVKSYFFYMLIIFVVIFIGLFVKSNLNTLFITSKLPYILATFFYSSGTLGFLVNVATWGNKSKAEITSRVILISFYCLGTFFTIIGLI